MANTFTRLGTANTFDAARQTLQTRQSTLADLQAKLTEGKRVVRPSRGPCRATSRSRPGQGRSR